MGTFRHCVLMTKKDDGTTVAVPLSRIPNLHLMLWIRAITGHMPQQLYSETEGKWEVTQECEEELPPKKRSSGSCAVNSSTDGLYHWTQSSWFSIRYRHSLILLLSISHPQPLNTENGAQRWRGGSREGPNLSFAMGFRASKNPWMQSRTFPRTSSMYWWETCAPLLQSLARASLASCYLWSGD